MFPGKTINLSQVFLIPWDTSCQEMHTISQEKAQKLRDTAQSCSIMRLRCRVWFLRMEPGRIIAAQGTGCLWEGFLQDSAQRHFPFLHFAMKTKILFRFLSVGRNRCSCRSSIKAKWHDGIFGKVVDALYLPPL